MSAIGLREGISKCNGCDMEVNNEELYIHWKKYCEPTIKSHNNEIERYRKEQAKSEIEDIAFIKMLKAVGPFKIQRGIRFSDSDVLGWVITWDTGCSTGATILEAMTPFISQKHD